MTIKTITVTIKGQDYILEYNESSGKYEKQLTAPADSSFNELGGYFPVTVKAESTAGNITTADSDDLTFGENLRLFTRENNKPTITITSPSNDAYVTDTRPEIRFTVKDNDYQTTGYSGINKESLVLKINGVPVDNSSVSWSPIDGGFECTYTPTTDIPDGLTQISVDIEDNDGNSADTAYSNFTIDTLAPDLTVTYPVDDSIETNQQKITVTGTTDDTTSKPVTITISVNGVDQGAVVVSEDGSFEKEVSLSQGENTITVTATDKAGKETVVTRKVILDTVKPVFKSIEITPNPVEVGKLFTISIEVE